MTAQEKELVIELYQKLGKAYNLTQDRLDNSIGLFEDERENAATTEKCNSLISEAENIYKSLMKQEIEKL